ncbi:ribonuclease BN (tRNA processing enzyme) [Paenibacillus favisporus]|uniref:Ribonuclease BN (tRNA processing enzyme) n=1 Tax=Paenibacillus favisporus TaxID=221028 RepID=A0ABV2EXE7_9BACL
MSLQLQMLGTGSAFAKKYFNNNALLGDGSFTLLIDCGITAPLALHQLGKTFNDLDAVLITHIHGDHVGGLEELAFKMKYAYRRKMKLFIAEALRDVLWEHTLKGGLSQPGEITCLEDAFDVHTLQPGVPCRLSEQIELELIPNRHIPGKDSFSLYINGRIFYSADMTFDPGLLDKLVRERGCDTILHEVQLEGPGEVHTTLSELLSLPEPVQRMIRLMHYADNKDGFVGKTGEMTFLEQGHLYTL